MVETNKLGHKSLTITNVAGSTLSREAIIRCYYTQDQKLLLHQLKLIQLKLLYYQFFLKLKAHGRDNGIDLLRELAKVTTAIETIVDDAPVMEKLLKNS